VLNRKYQTIQDSKLITYLDRPEISKEKYHEYHIHGHDSNDPLPNLNVISLDELIGKSLHHHQGEMSVLFNKLAFKPCIEHTYAPSSQLSSGLSSAKEYLVEGVSMWAKAVVVTGNELLKLAAKTPSVLAKKA
jgi:hypothetical protein